MSRFAYVVVSAAISLGLAVGGRISAPRAAPGVLAEGTEPIPIPPWAHAKRATTPFVQLAEGTEPIPIPPWSPSAM